MLAENHGNPALGWIQGRIWKNDIGQYRDIYLQMSLKVYRMLPNARFLRILGELETEAISAHHWTLFCVPLDRNPLGAETTPFPYIRMSKEWTSIDAKVSKIPYPSIPHMPSKDIREVTIDRLKMMSKVALCSAKYHSFNVTQSRSHISKWNWSVFVPRSRMCVSVCL